MDANSLPFYGQPGHGVLPLLPFAHPANADESGAPRNSSSTASRLHRADSTLVPARDILVMEDDPHVAEVLCMALQDEGFTLDTAADGEQGLALLRSGQYRLLLLDLIMPRVDGFGVLRELQAQPALRPPAIVALSALQQQDDIVRALEAGADDYLTKPFDVGDLTVRVNLWLRRLTSAGRSTSPGLRVYSLGGFSVEYGGRVRLHHEGKARKAGILFRYLLTHQERAVSTAELHRLLWPHAPQDLAATDLRSLLRHLRRLLGFSAHRQSRLIHTGTTLALRLEPDDWWDVAEFRALLSAGAQAQSSDDVDRALDAYLAAVALYGGDYLADDVQAHWAVPYRERYREDWLDALCAIAALRGQRREYREQEAVLRMVVRADPYREVCYRDLMALLVAQGRGAEALVLYRRLEQVLQTEFGASPAPQTRALAASIGQVSPSV
jgi:DNA-binding response OmpR family regulator